MPQNQRNAVLALDLGKKYIGVSLYRKGLGISPMDPFIIRNIYEFEAQIDHFVKEYGVATIVVGDMGLQNLPELIDSVLRKVAKKHNILTKTIEERLSTFQAEKEMGEAGGDKKSRSAHSHSAVNILKDYLFTIG